MADSRLADIRRTSAMPAVLVPDRKRLELHLPTPLTSFIGREREVAALEALVRQPDVRLLTLTGPGGVGKTRLALALAVRLTNDFPDGVGFVNLAPVTHPDLVVPAVARVLSVREAGDEPLVARLQSFLRDRCLLLVLDNYEHVIDAAPLVSDLLSAAPGITILVTSRARLQLSGEHEHVVRPLGLAGQDEHIAYRAVAEAPAIQLFVARAQAIQEEFVLTAENAAAVAAICRRLDGLPLAIELAAGRIKVFPPQALQARLEQSLPLLSGGGRDLPARQQTMWNTIAWSYDLLTDEEKRLFRRLAVFVGGFSLEAAEAIVGRECSRDVVDGITTLVENSLLHQEMRSGGEEEPRFRMLETVREFAVEGLAASDDEGRVRQAHAMWFLTLAEAAESWTWGGSTQQRWLDRLELELPNLRAALAWFNHAGDADAVACLAAALAWYWLLRSHRAEGRAWLERALAQGITADRTRAKALLALGVLEELMGSQRVPELLDQSLGLSQRLKDSRGMAQALLMLGVYARNQGEHARAKPLLVEANELAAEIGDLHIVALARLHLGVVVLDQDGAERAEPVLAETLALLRRQDDAYTVASTLLVLGWTATDRRDIATAAARYVDSLALWEELGTQEGVVDVLAGVAALLEAAGQPERATRLLVGAEALAEAVGYVLPIPERARYGRTQAQLRETLGEVAFTEAWATGLVISPEHAVAEGRAVLAGLLEGLVAQEPPVSPAAGGLTSREREVLRLVVAGRSNPEIAAALFLSRRTVTTHLTNIFAKLGVTGRAEAAVLAVRRGLV